MDAYLVAFEYGSGTLWGYVSADSEDQIAYELPEVDVYDTPPGWMTVGEVAPMRIDTIPITTAHVIQRAVHPAQGPCDRGSFLAPIVHGVAG